MGDTTKVQNLFLICLSSVYLIAFVSLFVQIPGLYGDNGILPVRLEMNKEISTLGEIFKTQPTLLHLLPKVGLTGTELGFNLICLLGVLLSFAAFTSATFRNTWSFCALWIFYKSLVQVGQTFMFFQWDTLLLEIGFLAIFIAPLRLPFVDSSRLTKHSRSVSFWLVRWLAFRLMFGSGVVKLNSQCPTWWGLTAMTYHYESQCIPTPLAWYAHQLPLWFQKASTANVFVIQICTSILFFSPLRAHRIASFCIQTFLMVLILLTGNYNFFNWVAIVLCLSLLDDDFGFFKASKARETGKDSAKSKKLGKTFLCRLMNCSKKIIHMSVVVFIAYLSNRYFSLKLHFNPLWIESNIEFSIEDFQNFLHVFVPITIWIGAASLLFTILSAIYKSLKQESTYKDKVSNAIAVVMVSFVAMLIFSMSLVPYTYIDKETARKLPTTFNTWYANTQKYDILHSYGLFRSMTGVGGRPEVIVEGANDLDGKWEEFNFLYKPGDVNRSPPVVAPHQPRLDWQMWFAALGTHNYNPWFYHLVYRILNHQKEVLDLMDEGPFQDAPPKYVRARLFHYHYTSINETTDAWWRREEQREYLPALSLDNKHLISYVEEMNLQMDPDRTQKGVTDKKSLASYFFLYLHTIVPAKYGFEACVSFLLVGIACLYFGGKTKQKPNQSHFAKNPRSDVSSQQSKTIKASKNDKLKKIS